MEVVGELINASRQSIAEAIKEKDEDRIKKVAGDQEESGADFIDVNAGTFTDAEEEYLIWLVRTVQEAITVSCAIDSSNPEAIEAALSVHKGIPMINSISLEKERYERLMPIVSGTDFKVVALCVSDEGMPQGIKALMVNAEKLVNGLVNNNVPLDNIYVDPMVKPLSVNDTYGVEALEAFRTIKATYPGVHTICGISNLSFGLANRRLVNQVFVVAAIMNGLDAGFLDPLDRRLMANIIVAESIAGKDRRCMKYMKAFRGKKFVL